MAVVLIAAFIITAAEIALAAVGVAMEAAAAIAVVVAKAVAKAVAAPPLP